MADNIDEENLDNPINNQSENPPDEIVSNFNTETISPNQETENMEVHHHAHHEGKKNWRSYFFPLAGVRRKKHAAVGVFFHQPHELKITSLSS